jgi:histidine phosphotransferase ChpT
MSVPAGRNKRAITGATMTRGAAMRMAGFDVNRVRRSAVVGSAEMQPLSYGGGMAGDTFDLRIAEFLAARLCHDLVSPIGAIANGLEILEDEPELAGDAGALIGLSARQAARRLQFFRVAFGSTAALPDDVARRAAIEFFADGKVALDWRVAAVPAGWQKLACNLLLVASEALPRGGRIALEAAAPGGLAATAEGDNVRLADPIPSLLANRAEPDALSPRTVQAIFTAALADRANAIVEVRYLNAGKLALVVKVKS